MNAIFAPVLLPTEIKDADNRTQNSLLLVHLARRAYRVEHHEYPATLKTLVPDYLPCVPADPFALADPLRYKRVGGKYVLYSIGPDGRDDGGRPIFDAKKIPPDAWHTFDPRYTVEQKGQGDIVAGLNTNSH